MALDNFYHLFNLCSLGIYLAQKLLFRLYLVVRGKPLGTIGTDNGFFGKVYEFKLLFVDAAEISKLVDFVLDYL